MVTRILALWSLSWRTPHRRSLQRSGWQSWTTSPKPSLPCKLLLRPCKHSQKPVQPWNSFTNCFHPHRKHSWSHRLWLWPLFVKLSVHKNLRSTFVAIFSFKHECGILEWILAKFTRWTFTWFVGVFQVPLHWGLTLLIEKGTVAPSHFWWLLVAVGGDPNSGSSNWVPFLGKQVRASRQLVSKWGPDRARATLYLVAHVSWTCPNLTLHKNIYICHTSYYQPLPLPSQRVCS